MTTPAENISDFIEVPYRQWTPENGWSTDPAGVVRKSWFKRVRPESKTIKFVDGWRAPGSWYNRGYDFKYPGGITYAVHRVTGERLRGYDNGAMWGGTNPLASLPSAPSYLKSEAEVKALNDLKNQSVHLGEFLAEGKQTARMIGDNLFSIARSVQRFKRSYPKLWKRVKKYQNGHCPRYNWHKIPSRWLEVQYGWNPLLSDIRGAMIHLSRKFEVGAVFRASGTSRRPIEVTRRQGVRFGGSPNNYWETSVSGQHIGRCNLWFRLVLPHLAEQSALGLLNPVEIIWEMVPYSFVVDWALPIGPWLSSLTADAGYKFKSGSFSLISRAEEAVSAMHLQHAAYRYEGFMPSPTCRYWDFARSTYTTTPVPGFYVKNPISATHALNAIALLLVAFGRK